MNKIKIVTVRVGSLPVIEEIDDTLEAMQAVVGGCIEMVLVAPGVYICCNEDGIALGLPQNGCGMLGPYFFVGTDEESGDNQSLTPGECYAMMNYAMEHAGDVHPIADGVTFTINDLNDSTP
jgi:hypothetical protein